MNAAPPAVSAEFEVELACRTLAAARGDSVRTITVVLAGNDQPEIACLAVRTADRFMLDAVVSIDRRSTRVRLFRRRPAAVPANRAGA